MQKQIRVLIVDDSAFMRKVISDFISGDSRLEVIGTARNGAEALVKIKELRPDVVTLDVEMPVMNGLEALKEIMKENPVPVVMLSSTTQEGAENTVLAMQYGAVDFVAKPSGAISLDLYKVKEDIVNKIYRSSQANVRGMRQTKSSFTSRQELIRNSEKKDPKISGDKKLVCIGTSTGGPRALQELLVNLPKNISAPILIVQHMPPGFTKSLANRLHSICEINVKEAEEGEIIQNGTAYIAPGGFHLTVRQVGTAVAVHLDTSDPINGHRPSVDVMFSSVSKLNGFSYVTVIMTGMGADGANGLKLIKQKGNDSFAIAESIDSSVVFGMPKAAIATNLVDEILHLNDIAGQVIKCLK